MERNPREHVLATEERFGGRVRALREATGYPQRHVAAVMTLVYGLEWGQQTVARVESAQRPIRLIEAAALAELFDLPLADLLDDFRPSTKPPGAQARTLRGAAGLLEIHLMREHLQQREQELRDGGGK
jgi:transcriptional regulator with XRE-family HTH domain